MMKTCLVVDDSRVVRNVARHMLESMGFAVDEAADGKEALDRCRESLPDVVLLDWNMPVMSGLDFLVALDETDLEPRPKIVFCTTETAFAHVRIAMEAGADEYLMKPFDRDSLRDKFELVGVA